MLKDEERKAFFFATVKPCMCKNSCKLQYEVNEAHFVAQSRLNERCGGFFVVAGGLLKFITVRGRP